MSKLLKTIWISLALLIFVSPVNAGPFDRPGQLGQMAEFKLPESKFLPSNPRPRAGEKKAAAYAKNAFPDAKILSVNYMQRDGSYRVKVLSRGGVVKYIFVDPDSGEVFE